MDGNDVFYNTNCHQNWRKDNCCDQVIAVMISKATKTIESPDIIISNVISRTYWNDTIIFDFHWISSFYLTEIGIILKSYDVSFVLTACNGICKLDI